MSKQQRRHLCVLAMAAVADGMPRAGGAVKAAHLPKGIVALVVLSLVATVGTPAPVRGDCSWSALGTGADNTVQALAVMPNGDLIVGGSFLTAGGVTVNNIARWDGNAWSALGTGTSGGVGGPAVLALAVMPNGHLIAGGGFDVAGGVTVHHIAEWDGSAWSALGTGMNFATSALVYALAVLPDGNLIAGGGFNQAGGVTGTVGIALWDGYNWFSLSGTGVSGPTPKVYALAVMPNGDLIAGGAFDSIGGVSGTSKVAIWWGGAWHALPNRPTSTVWSLAVMPNGDLIAGGSFLTVGGVTVNRIVRWDGSAWSALGAGLGSTGSGYVYSLAVMPNGDLIAGGSFTTAQGAAGDRIARWDGSAWSALGTGTDNTVQALASKPNGDLIAGGLFVTAGGVTVNKIARWACPSALLGDMDNDADVDLDDLPFFVDVLLGNTTPPGILPERADMNGDTYKDGADIQLFVDALLP